MFQNKAFWWVALLVNMAVGAWWHTCRIKELCDTAARVTVTAPAPETPPAPAATDSVASPAAPDTAATSALPQTEQGLAEAEKFGGDVFKPLDLYFAVGRTDYIRTPDNQRFLDEAKTYLAAHPDKKLLLTGHTDSEGPDDLNLRLSKRRAEAVKDRFQRLGIPAAQLATDGKGETQPKASNDSPAGRRANRRVSIVVQ
jgi:OOP family OmpA-OmpF porin